MNKSQHEAFFSKRRMNRYFAAYPGNESKGLYLYEANVSISAALYNSLSVLEVALRNRINQEMVRQFGRSDWYAEWYLHPVLRHAWPEINNAIRHLHEDGKTIEPDKVVASLMFGFWTSLFNDRYERVLWSRLRFVFPEMPKRLRQRKNISAPLNDIRRNLRNRVYHNEPIIFNLNSLDKHYQYVLLLLRYMGADLYSYNTARDFFPATLAGIRTQLQKL